MQKETLKAFKEIKSHEFRRINMYKPEKLAQKFEEFLKEVREQERTKSINIDKGLLAS